MRFRWLPITAASLSFALFSAPASALVVPCQNNADCDDGLFCTINEACDPVLGCIPGTPRLCEDEFLCTVDVCNEIDDTCLHTPNDLLCADASFCDGAEVCNALLGCQEGTPACNDGVQCTVDSCNEAVDVCTNLPDHGMCDEGSICTPAGCTPPVICENDGDCDDDVGCTVDSCNQQLGVCTNLPEQSACDDGNPCTTDLCLPLLDCQHVSLPDLDLDGRCDVFDNCPVEANPDQADSDCPDPTFAEAGGCLSGDFDPLGDPRRGCCDGGDVCDLCPARAIGSDGLQACNITRSGGINCPAESGCTLTTTDGCISVSVPPGALEADRSISVTDHIDEAQNLLLRDSFLYQIGLRPEDIAPTAPIQVSVCWLDRDADDLADEGTCEGDNGTVDLGLSCDHDDDCTSDFCSRPSTTPERNLLLKRNSEPFSGGGAFAGSFSCQDHDATSSNDNACDLAAADCSEAGHIDGRTLAGCCDMQNNRWTVSTCRFSELVFGEFAGDLLAGAGTRLNDCHAEWNTVNPHNDPLRDAQGLPSIDQVCRDGDPLCDHDGQADGACTFSVGVCFNLTDRRMTDGNANRLCTSTDITEWRIDGEGVSIASLRNAVAALGGEKNTGGVTFASALDDANACTRLVPVKVALDGGQDTTVQLRMAASTGLSTDAPTLPSPTTTLPPQDPLCGDLDGNGSVFGSDALSTLRSAVGSRTCDPVLCDVDADAIVTATDALGVLNTAVEKEIELTCGRGPLPSDRDRLRLTCRPALEPFQP
ncbi:MAG TPA: hypothetical protein VEC57_20615 [Candidatus Limnocylindrales bacterium]|nr:hypothetical protein [Candidatus Limnocylindrales bacterium]